MRAKFIRGLDPKAAMGTGMASEFPEWNLFHLLHQEANDSENFQGVTPIDYDHKTKYQHANKSITDDPNELEIEPRFSIESKFRYSTDTKGENVKYYMFTLYLTREEGIILHDNNTDDEKQITDLRMFNKVTHCYDINEAYNFERGVDPKKSMSIGSFSERNRVKNFLDDIKKDYQLDENDDRYLGFINVYEDGFMNQEDKDAFAIFVNTWPKYKKLMEDAGLELSEYEPDIEETLFQNKK